MARGRQKSEARRQRILDAAIDCFVEQGFHRASMQQICAKAETSPGALYRYFKSKDEIIEAIAESERADIAGILVELAKTREISKSLGSIGVEILQHAADSVYGRLAIEVVAEASRNRRVATIIAETDQELRTALIDALQRAQALGTADSRLPAAASADLLLALLDGLTTRFLINPETDASDLQSTLATLITRFLQPEETRQPTAHE